MSVGAERSEAASPRGFQNPNAPEDERIDDLLAQLTLAEKIACLGTNPSVPRLGVAGTGHVEGLHGLALGGPGRWGGKSPVATTTFPQAIGLAQTWNPETVRAVAEVEAHETRYAFQNPGIRRGGLVVRAPNADLGRDPRWGRTEECYGEDPFLTGTMAVAFVRGLQGDHPRYWKTAALLKHFFANSNENGRERTSSDFDESLFRDYYSVPFRMAIEEGGSRAFMTAYNGHNGVPCTVHPVLQAVAVGEWGQDGIICTDATALHLLVSAHRSHPDLYTAAAACVRAGISQFLDDYEEAVTGALERGLLVERDLDRVLRGTFRVMLRLGLLDPPELVPYSRIGHDEPPPWSSEENRALVRQVTRDSIVLLKNEARALPLDASALRSIAVVGPFADRVLIDWYSGTPPYTVSPLEGIRRRVDPNVAVLHATSNDDSDALRIARSCDVCVVCVGNHPTGDGPWAEVTRASYGREAVDRRIIELEDEKLVRELIEANPRTVVVLLASFPYAIEWTKEHAPAIVLATHNSQELGTALADVLFGDANPAGRLVQTWPRRLADLPPLLDYDIRRGRTHLYATAEPLWPFGFGLSYTAFEYRSLVPSAERMDGNGAITVSVEIKNTGERAGDEVVQLYVRRNDRAAAEPMHRLGAFKRVSLRPGEVRAVGLTLRARDLAAWNPKTRRLEVRPGEIEIVVGGSSAHAALRRTVRID
jgi:beta-glucosidase